MQLTLSKKKKNKIKFRNFKNIEFRKIEGV